MAKKAVTPSSLFCHPGSSFVILSEAKDLPGDSSEFPRFAQDASE